MRVLAFSVSYVGSIGYGKTVCKSVVLVGFISDHASISLLFVYYKSKVIFG